MQHVINTLTCALMDLENVKPPVTEFRLHPDDLDQLRADCGASQPRAGMHCITVFHGIKIIEDPNAPKLRRVRS